MLNISWNNTLIIDFSNFYINMCSVLAVNKNVNSQINLIFVGAFHPRYILSNMIELREVSLTFNLTTDSENSNSDLILFSKIFQPHFLINWDCDKKSYQLYQLQSTDTWPFEYRPIYEFGPIFLPMFRYVCRQHSLYQFHLDYVKTSTFYWNLFNKIFHLEFETKFGIQNLNYKKVLSFYCFEFKIFHVLPIQHCFALS